jgi:branched-chain amino acid transport system ATP-binding protein
VTAEERFELCDVVAGYNGIPALHGISLTVSAGQVVALLGANGAGKTTTLLAAAGAIPPISGSVRLGGEAIVAKRPHQVARLGIGFVPERRGIVFQLSVAENLRLRQRHRRQSDLYTVLDLFPALGSLMKRRAGLLSGGEQQMLGLACALVAQPKVLLIDELSHGLAPIVVEGLLPVIRDISRERNMGVLLVEQHVGAALDIVDYVYVLNRGTVSTSGTPESIRRDGQLLETSYLGQLV